jgi:antitoxin component HigA of HigAB toxin-antitoxin module
VVSIPLCYDKRSTNASGITMFGADAYTLSRHKARMMDTKELLAELGRLKGEGKATNAEIGRLIGKPSSRVAEIFSGTRKITIEEMKAIVEHYGLGERAGPVSADVIEPILDAVLPLVPAGKLTDVSRRALAEAVSYGLALLGGTPATLEDQGAIQVAAKAAASRFRERGLS